MSIIKKHHVTQVQSSIRETNHLALEILEIGTCPQTLEWIRSNDSTLLVRLEEKIVCA